MGRAPCCDKVGLKKGRWTAEEDDILLKYIDTHGEGSWRSVPKKAGLLRCGKSCRLRWINYLKADVKRGNISKEEEDTIIKLHLSLGNRWSQIVHHLPGRTDNEIKNYWNSHLRLRVDTSHKSAPTDSDSSKVDLPASTKTGRRKKAKRTSRGSKKKSNNNNTTKEIKDKNTKETKVLLADSQSNSEEGFSIVLDPVIESIFDEIIRGFLNPGPLGSEMDAMLLCGNEGSQDWVPQEERALNEEGFSIVLDPVIESIFDEMIRGFLKPGPLGNEMDAMLLCGNEGSEDWVPQEERALNEERGSGADMVNEEREREPTGTQLAQEEEVGSAQIERSNLLHWDKLDWELDFGQEWSYCDSTVDFRIPCTNINNGNDLESLTSWLMSDLL